MIKAIIISLLFLLSCSGNQRTSNVLSNEPISHLNLPADSLPLRNIPADTLAYDVEYEWADTYIAWYLKNNEHLLQASSSHTLTYIKEVKQREETTYLEVRFGVSLPSRFEVRRIILLAVDTRKIIEYNTFSGESRPWPDQNKVKQEVPPSGTYSYNISFAEWGGQTMGEKVNVIIDSLDITVKSSGNNSAFGPPGGIIEQGKLRKHASGEWIITKKETDIYAEEIGGCTSGPSVIYFDLRRYEVC